MNETEDYLYSFLYFLSSSPDEQIKYCKNYIPVNAMDWHPETLDNNEQDSNSYWLDKRSNPLNIFYFEFEQAINLYMNDELCELSQDDTILYEILALLNLMWTIKENIGSYNYYWSIESLKLSIEWKIIRRLSLIALNMLKWSSNSPKYDFEYLVID